LNASAVTHRSAHEGLGLEMSAPLFARADEVIE
jgi:hypothetical protein